MALNSYTECVRCVIVLWRPHRFPAVYARDSVFPDTFDLTDAFSSWKHSRETGRGEGRGSWRRKDSECFNSAIRPNRRKKKKKYEKNHQSAPSSRADSRINIFFFNIFTQPTPKCFALLFPRMYRKRWPIRWVYLKLGSCVTPISGRIVLIGLRHVTSESVEKKKKRTSRFPAKIW